MHPCILFIAGERIDVGISPAMQHQIVDIIQYRRFLIDIYIRRC